MFIAALFIIAPSWKAPRCPSSGEGINCGIFTQWTAVHSTEYKWATVACNARKITWSEKKPDTKEPTFNDAFI